jgi:16S rRNA U516 pseudouridylate synthase RsuA-like enzyme
VGIPQNLTPQGNLKRTRIMSVRLAGLKVGQWRDLTAEEWLRLMVL